MILTAGSKGGSKTENALSGAGDVVTLLIPKMFMAGGDEKELLEPKTPLPNGLLPSVRPEKAPGENVAAFGCCGCELNSEFGGVAGTELQDC